MKSIPVVILLALFALAACTTTAPQDVTCQSRNEILEKLEGVVPYDEYSLSFNVSEGIASLTLWLVNPGLDSHVEEGLRDALGQALLEAAAVVHRMHQTDACVGELFDRVNVIIVDPDYVGVFSGVLSLGDIPDAESLSEEELVTLATSFEVDYRLREPMAAFIPPSDTACTWAETREKIARNFPASNLNVDFFYVFDALGSTVWAQFVGPVEGETAGYAVLKVREMTDALDCLYPAANKISTIVVNGEGEVTLVGSIAASDSPENTVNGFDINDYTYGLIAGEEGE
jgi:hypothetical protein